MVDRFRPDKTKVDATDAVKEAGTGVYDTKSGYRLPDGTLIDYHEQDDEAAGPAVDDGTNAVEEAAQARIDEDAPAPASDDEDATEREAGGSGIALEREFEGTNFELSEEQLAEVIGQTSSDDEDAEGLLGRIGRDDVAKGTPGEDLLGGGEESEPAAPFSDRPAAFQAGPDVREAGVFDLIDQPGASDGDPLLSFLGAAEAKLGRHTGLATPSDQKDASPAGKPSVSDAGAPHPPPEPEPVPSGPEPREVPVDYGPDTLHGPAEEPPPPREYTDDDQATLDRYGFLPGGKPFVPGPDGDDGYEIPPELRKQLDAELARMRAAKNAGGGGDGATDPSEIESEVVGAAGELPTHAELGESLFGQPDTTVETGGGGNVNPGADSQGAGVITPQDDQNVATGSRRNDDPFDATTPAPKPAAAEDAAADEGGESFLPPSEIAGRVDDPTDEVPDALDLPN
jgi:hypothetical protein